MEKLTGKISGEVRWYHVARSRALRRIIDKQIARWVELQPLRSDSVQPPCYLAVLQREGEGHFVHCQIEVATSAGVWSSARMGQGLQQALADCLKHMTLRAAV